MEDLIREAPFGQLVRWATGNRLFQYPEEKPEFQLPEAWITAFNSEKPRTLAEVQDEGEAEKQSSVHTPASEHAGDSTQDPAGTTSRPAATPRTLTASTISEDIKARETAADLSPYATRNSINVGHGVALARTLSRQETRPYTQQRFDIERQEEIERAESRPIVPQRTNSGDILVDWYTTDDPANPQNWTGGKKLWVSFVICLYTFVVYTGSAIYTSSIEGIIEEFHVTVTVASLGLSLYVLAYGIGPLFFAPMSEIPSIGRSPVYFSTFVMFVIFSVPAGFVNNFAGLMVLRFLQGFFGSPCLANGAASMQDIYSMMQFPYALIAWVSASFCGPALGPLLSGFAIEALGWRWSLYEIAIACGPVLLLMFAFLPETSTPNILLRRAKRLRKLCDNERIRSQAEIDQAKLKPSEIIWDAMIKPIEITVKDPAITFVTVYTAIVYGTYYSFFEVFPLVFPVYYGFSLGMVGVVFTCILVSAIIGIILQISYLKFYLFPDILRNGFRAQESRLVPALIFSFGPVIGLFLFAWTARPSIHWIAPTIGITIYGASVFIVVQSIFTYVPMSYPQYAASLFAANDFFRSALACGSIHFSTPMFINLGVGKGTSLLGGLSVIGIIGIMVLYRYGAQMRARSKFAVHEADAVETSSVKE